MDVLIFLVIMSVAVGVFAAPVIFTTEWFANFRQRWAGKKRIYCKRKCDGDAWYSWVWVDPLGDLIGYRYPSIKGGHGAMRLNEDGTGYYCGDIEWVEVP